VLFRSSAPFTSAATYRAALAMMVERDADLIVGMKRVEPSHVFVGEQRADASVMPIILQMQRAGEKRRRQDFPEDWTMSGGCYLFRVGMFVETGDIYGGIRCYGVLQPRWEAIEIDTPEDLEMAEYAAERGYVRAEESARGRAALRAAYRITREAMIDAEGLP
jgi:CMP-N-acetylneuraminic acid synthetase